MKKIDIRKNLPYIITLTMIALIIILSIRTSMRFSDFGYYLIEDKLTENVESLSQHLESSKGNTKAAAISMSKRPDAIRAIKEHNREEIIRIFSENYELYQVNYFTVTDAAGNVIARTHEPENYGDSILNQQNIQDALKGESNSYFEAGTVVKISVRTGAPVYDENGTLIGAISAGMRFDTDETVDTIKYLLGADVTVFFGDERIATTLIFDGERQIGTKLDAEIADIVINQKQEYVGELELFGTWYETYYEPLFNADGDVFAIIFLGIPIDDLRSESNTLRFEVVLIAVMCIAISFVLLRSIRNMDMANKAKSSFLATMSHEIRTPMNAILGITEIQMQKETHDDDTKIALEKIYASGDLLLGIINDILDLSKIEAGKLELLITEYELASLISDTSQLNMMRIGSKPIVFELDIDKNVPVRVLGDELRVKQVLNNLLSNAFKYTAKGTVKMSVSSKPAVNMVMLVFTVEDTGQGMSKDQVSKLFDEYTRFNKEANRNTEGTGLGMSITRNLIRLMDGEFIIESEPNKGSKFTVSFPQGIVSDDVLGEEMVENLHRFRTSSSVKMRRTQIMREYMPYGSVLVVDDVETNIYVAKGLLTPYGLKIDSAESGYEAIEKLESGKIYDIIFMDHMMPDMDGIETTKRIREMGYTEPIVALTANAVAGQAEIFLGSGFDDFISKPIDMRQMNAVLNKFVRDRQPPDVIEAARKAAEEMKKQKGGAGKPIAVKDEDKDSSIFTEAFVRDAKKSLEILDKMFAKGGGSGEGGGTFSEDELRKFTIHVHGLKSALANIGQMELSAIALKLETLGREGREEDVAAINEQAPPFIISLRTLVEKMTPEEDNATDSAEMSEADSKLLQDKFSVIIKACEDFDSDAAEKAIEELKKQKWPKQVSKLLSAVSEFLLHSDFDEAANAVKGYINSTKN